MQATATEKSPIILGVSIGLASCGGAVLTINLDVAQDVAGGTAPVETKAEQTPRALNIANRTDSPVFSTMRFESTNPQNIATLLPMTAIIQHIATSGFRRSMNLTSSRPTPYPPRHFPGQGERNPY